MYLPSIFYLQNAINLAVPLVSHDVSHFLRKWEIKKLKNEFSFDPILYTNKQIFYKIYCRIMTTGVYLNLVIAFRIISNISSFSCHRLG